MAAQQQHVSTHRVTGFQSHECRDAAHPLHEDTSVVHTPACNPQSSRRHFTLQPLAICCVHTCTAEAVHGESAGTRHKL